MATITINGRTHREACCHKAEDWAEAEYDQRAPQVFVAIAAKAAEVGHVLKVEPQATGATSYRVDAETGADEQAAHDFMRSDVADFWSYA